ncbi:MAG: sugar transferase [Phycisphaerales bacterium]
MRATTTSPESARPTVWGMDPVQLHSRFWASRGIQVVRLGEPSELVRHAELYLLTDPRTLTLFRLAPVVEQLSWLGSELLQLRLRDQRDRGYRELVRTGVDGRFERFQRDYGGSDMRLARVALTPERGLASVWQSAPDPRTGWRKLREAVGRSDRWTMSVEGHVYDRQADAEVAAFVHDLVSTWDRPDATTTNIRPAVPRVWTFGEGKVPATARCSGPIWIGAGRTLPEGAIAVGPSVLWDDPASRPVPEDVRWLDLEPSDPLKLPVRAAQRTQAGEAVKRVFDIVFALAALAITLPLYPLIALAILIEDPGPIFFVHERETKGGKTFGCIKFRSMRKDAERIKRELMTQNKADGPQFYIPNDPRLTRVGRFLRKLQLDEIPQFLNVLRGSMSVVGPRPSPFSENQFCPPWREARLSVRPGVTGLWQVKRTRTTGVDFQEWIRYDIEYVETASFWLDLYIIWRTLMLLVRGVTRS